MAATSNENSWVESELDSEVDADCGVVTIGATAILAPYQDEPIITESAQERDEEDVDIDGISINILELMFRKRSPLNKWFVKIFICIIQSCFYNTRRRL